MNDGFGPGIIVGIMLSVLFVTFFWTEHVYDYNIEIAQKACAPHGGIQRIKAHAVKEPGRHTITTCKDGTEITMSNKP